jgi:hypothetical protein
VTPTSKANNLTTAKPRKYKVVRVIKRKKKPLAANSSARSPPPSSTPITPIAGTLKNTPTASSSSAAATTAASAPATTVGHASRRKVLKNGLHKSQSSVAPTRIHHSPVQTTKTDLAGIQLSANKQGLNFDQTNKTKTSIRASVTTGSMLPPQPTQSSMVAVASPPPVAPSSSVASNITAQSVSSIAASTPQNGTPLMSVLTTAAPALTSTPPSAIQVQATSGPIKINSTVPADRHSLTILKNVSFNQPGSRIIQRADASGLTTTLLASNGSSISPPPLTKEVIEWLSKERLKGSERSIELQNEVQTRRHDLMMQRQVGAARQMRLANRLSGLLARELVDNELDERRVESDLNRHDQLRKQLAPRRELLWRRFNDIHQALALIR